MSNPDYLPSDIDELRKQENLVEDTGRFEIYDLGCLHSTDTPDEYRHMFKGAARLGQDYLEGFTFDEVGEVMKSVAMDFTADMRSFFVWNKEGETGFHVAAPDLAGMNAASHFTFLIETTAEHKPDFAETLRIIREDMEQEHTPTGEAVDPDSMM